MTTTAATETKPAIAIFWDPATQCLRYDADPEQIKTGDMLVMLLEQAADLAKFGNGINRMQVAQQQMMAAAQHEALRQKLIGH